MQWHSASPTEVSSTLNSQAPPPTHLLASQVLVLFLPFQPTIPGYKLAEVRIHHLTICMHTDLPNATGSEWRSSVDKAADEAGRQAEREAEEAARAAVVQVYVLTGHCEKAASGRTSQAAAAAAEECSRRASLDSSTQSGRAPGAGNPTAPLRLLPSHAQNLNVRI